MTTMATRTSGSRGATAPTASRMTSRRSGCWLAPLTQRAGADEGVPEAAEQGAEGHSACAEARGGPGQLEADHRQEDAGAEAGQRQIGHAASDASPRDDVHDCSGDDDGVQDGQDAQDLAGEGVRERRRGELDPDDAERQRRDGDVDGPLDAAALARGHVREQERARRRRAVRRSRAGGRRRPGRRGRVRWWASSTTGWWRCRRGRPGSGSPARRSRRPRT